MCGIAGIVATSPDRTVGADELRRMLGTLRHRGPDQFGIYTDAHAGLGNARLSIVDLGGGQQPIANEDGTRWIVFNGEIFNHVELRPELEARGHRFVTHCDTEVILHLYEEYGAAGLSRLNGQFAIAIWDARERTLFLARDRLGVRPLFYTRAGGRFVFGSEIKALFAVAGVRAEIEPAAIGQAFTFWTALSPRSAFRDIVELPPGHCALLRDGTLTLQEYWHVDFDPAPADTMPLAARVEEFHELLVDATRLRLRADVPVGAYLSGGLDSSLLASLVRHCTTTPLETFSIAFDDANYDESGFQREMARHLGTQHHVVQAAHADIGRVFPDVVWHAEAPLLRTSPAPMFLLSKLVRDRGYKVVLTGEGADEFLAGYDIFKEARIRRFWAREPGSTRRPRLLRRLYQDIPGFSGGNEAFLTAFFKDRLADVDAPWYSHYIRWRNNRRNGRFLAAGARSTAPNAAAFLDEVAVPDRFHRWGPLERAQFLEIAIFLSGYLLSSQGDRMGMAHSVEGRFPFLDYRVVEYCCRLPSDLKLRSLREKFLLKQVGRRWLPEVIWQRPKRPYRAPIHRSFFNAATPDYVRELTSPTSLRESGLFNPAAVGQLIQRIDQGSPLGETDDMALAGILSTQLLHFLFVKNPRHSNPLGERDDVKVCGRAASSGDN